MRLVRLHIKRLERSRITMDDDWPIELLRDNGFFIASEVIAKLRGIIFLLQESDRVFIGQPRKRRLHRFQFYNIALEHSEFAVAGEAPTTAEALELVSRRRCDLLLVDHRLPDRFGTEFVRELRGRGRATARRAANGNGGGST